MKIKTLNSKTQAKLPANAALFKPRNKPSFLNDAVAQLAKPRNVIVISQDVRFLENVKGNCRLAFAAVGLDRVLIEQENVFAKLKAAIATSSSSIIVDMRWAVLNSEVLGSLELWGGVAERLCSDLRISVLSVYDQSTLIEEQMQAALRAHSQIIAPSGIYKNPYWLPEKILLAGALDEQLAFMLGRVVPDHEENYVTRKNTDMARGATPKWLAKNDTALGGVPASARWQIHCFGNLQVFVGGKIVNWRIAGGTPKKTQTLFAYLLQSGEKGAHAEQLGELLWPEEELDEKKRARLHHTMAMLRKTLGAQQSVIRAGDNYRLNAPLGSWIDIHAFEQQCRKGLSLFKKNDLESALLVYMAADQLYGGDLFENLPREYVESENENWCLPRRMWLREMALKLQNDITSVLMRMGRTREALDYCQKALAIDPASEVANEVAMRIFAVQGRDDAVHRQYKQYQQALKAMGESENPELRAQYRLLSSKEKPKNAD